MTTAIYENRSHFAPVFEISLESGNVDATVLRDVQEVTYSEGELAMDSFEFTLNDWDPHNNSVIYSSPYDESGSIRKVNDKEITPFEPGTKLTLKMGYVEHPDEPMVMMQGVVLSVEPDFPASGLPTVSIRAVSALNEHLNSSHSEEFNLKTVSEIFESIATNQLGYSASQLEAPNKGNEGPLEYQVISEQSPLEFLLELAEQSDYQLRLKTDAETGDETLYFGPQVENDNTLALTWGRTLISFSPKVQTKDMVEKVKVSGWDPTKSGEDRAISVEVGIDDLNIKHKDKKLIDSVKDQVSGSVESIVDENYSSEAEAEQRAKDVLTKRFRSMITASGSCVGDPRIRTGITLSIAGLGVRYDGDYIVTSATHTINGSGYMVSFECEYKEIVA